MGEFLKMARSLTSPYWSVLTFPFAVALALVVTSLMSSPARAIPPMVAEFKAKYVAQEPASDQDKAFAEMVTEAKCNVCHVADEKKTERNRFGVELSKLIDKDQVKAGLENTPEETKKELGAAFDKVAALPYQSGQENSPTFGQVISLGRLPGADHDVNELLAALSPDKLPDAAQTATAAMSGSVSELVGSLMEQLKSEIKSDVADELTEKLKTELMKELMAKLPDAIQAGILAKYEADEREQRLAMQGQAIQMIEEIGGTVREIAANDDRKEVAFHLSGKELTDDGLAHVRSIDQMIMLHLKGTQITDDGLLHLSGLPSLEKLHLEETKLTDKGLAHLLKIPKLKWLNIYGTEVTDAGIEQLKEMKDLDKLYIWQTKITLPGFERLKAALPNTEIIPDLVKEKQRAEEEAIRKIEEAKKAEEEKKKAEEEAKKKEEEEKKKAEEEAKKKEEEEKKKAEEAKKAEEEAKKKAEEEAAKKAEEKDKPAEEESTEAESDEPAEQSEESAEAEKESE